jgi:hypothetical protein
LPLVDQLLPAQPVAIGDKWKCPGIVWAQLLALDEVRQCDVELVLKEVTPEVARMEFAGAIKGSGNGAPTEVEVKGKCRFDLRSKRVDWFAMLLKEKRDISLVEDGVDFSSRIQVQITPKASSAKLTDAALKDVALEPTPELCQLRYQSTGGDWEVTHDRCWHSTRQQKSLVVFHMLGGGRQVSMCRISPLSKVAQDKPPTLAQFQEDIRKALGNSFGQIQEAGRDAADASRQVYRVLVAGQVSDVPIQWQYYLVSDQQNRSMALVFTTAEKFQEQFGKQGERLVQSFRFLEAKVEKKEKK